MHRIISSDAPVFRLLHTRHFYFQLLLLIFLPKGQFHSMDVLKEVYLRKDKQRAILFGTEQVDVFCKEAT
jgi:hypothetical protein